MEPQGQPAMTAYVQGRGGNRVVAWSGACAHPARSFGATSWSPPGRRAILAGTAAGRSEGQLEEVLFRTASYDALEPESGAARSRASALTCFHQPACAGKLWREMQPTLTMASQQLYSSIRRAGLGLARRPATMPVMSQAVRLYAAAAGLDRNVVEERVLSVLKSFSKVDPNKVPLPHGICGCPVQALVNLRALQPLLEMRMPPPYRSPRRPASPMTWAWTAWTLWRS